MLKWAKGWRPPTEEEDTEKENPTQFVAVSTFWQTYSHEARNQGETFQTLRRWRFSPRRTFSGCAKRCWSEIYLHRETKNKSAQQKPELIDINRHNGCATEEQQMTEVWVKSCCKILMSWLKMPQNALSLARLQHQMKPTQRSRRAGCNSNRRPTIRFGQKHALFTTWTNPYQSLTFSGICGEMS